MWIQYALFSSFSWAIIHILDEYCVDNIFSKPWLGVITSSSISVGIFVLIPFLNLTVVIPNSTILCICLMTGAIIQLSQLFYFRALDNSDSGTVAAYWNLTPVLLPIVSYWLFGSLITGSNYLGIILLIIASVGLCSIDKFSSRWDTLYLMSIAAGLQTIAILLEKYIFDRADFFGAFLAINVGIILSGLASFASTKVRITLVRDLPKIKQALPIFIAIELINWVALYTGQIAVKLGDPALVSAIGASTPAYAFGLSLLMAMFGQRLDAQTQRLHQRQRETRRKLPMKCGLVGLMMVGVWLIGTSAKS
jgi:drug/metabolite transporter (DMT)-like permease